MSRSFRKGRHPGNIASAMISGDHLSPIRNTGKVNRHLLQRLAKRRRSAQSLRKREMHIYDNERQAMLEFMHRHRLWNEPQRQQAFIHEARRCAERTARSKAIASGIADWLDDLEVDAADRAELDRAYEQICDEYDSSWWDRDLYHEFEPEIQEDEGSCYSDEDEPDVYEHWY